MGRLYNEGDKVRLASTYNGTFKEFKGRDLTVMRYYPKEGTDGPWVTIKEISEVEKYHLIKTLWIIRVKK